MPPQFSLPKDLPSEWSDLMRFARTRDDYRDQFSRRLLDGKNKDEQKKELTRVAAKLFDSPARGRFKTVGGVEKGLKAYFKGTRDLTLQQIATLIQITGVTPRVSEFAPFDLFRRRWITQDSSKWGKSKPRPITPQNLDMQLWRAQSVTPERVINAVYRTWPRRPEAEAPGKRTFHLSLGGGLLVVLDGSVDIRFLGRRSPVRVSSNSAVGYRMNWPHRVIPTSDDTVALELCASSRGAPTEYFIDKYESPLIGEFPSRGKEVMGSDPARHLVSHALASCKIGANRLAEFFTIPYENHKEVDSTKLKNKMGKLRDLVKGKTDISFSLVLEIAHALRMPESHFFTSLHAHLDKVATKKTSLDPGTRMDTIPTEVYGRRSRLTARVVQMDAPAAPGSFEAASIATDPEMGGERLVTVLDGALGVALFGGAAGTVCRGTLEVGDSLWLRPSLLAHGFFVPDPGRPPRYIDATVPYRVNHGPPWGRSE